MTGDKVTACLKTNPATKEIPVIINTAFARGSQTKRALDSGAAEIVQKPFNLTTLRTVLAGYLSASDETTITKTPEEQNNYRSRAGAEETIPQVTR